MRLSRRLGMTLASLTALLAGAFASATVPDLPPADPERLAITVAIWREASPGAALPLGSRASSERVASQVAAARYPSDPTSRDRFAEGLRLRLDLLFESDFARVREKALPCLAYHMASTMSVAQLRATLDFARGEAGRRFWLVMVEPADSRCFDAPLAEMAQPAVVATERWMLNPR